MKYFIIFLFLTIAIVTGAQNNKGTSLGTFSGKIIDTETNKAMQYVSVVLYNQKDSTFLTGAVTNEVGEFNITQIPFDYYYAKCSFIGFKTKTISNISVSKKTKNQYLNNILLTPDLELLTEVNITGEKQLVRYEIDKKVVNVESMNTVASATALEVLENIPSVTVDLDGNVSLRGSSGFTLLIDNKPSNMKASEALQLIPASNIKDIEIITNPSAQYNAEGASGIINIILKKNKLEGISTLINLNGGNYSNYGGDFILSINKEKLKFNLGGFYKNGNRYRDIFQERIITIDQNISKVQSEGLHRFFRTNYGLNTALEWNPNRKSSFSLALSGNQRQYNAAAKYNFEEYYNENLIAEYRNDEQTLRQFYGTTLSSAYEYLIKGNKQHRISTSIMYNYHDGNEDALTENFDENNTKQGGYNSTEIGPSQLIRLKIDYQKPLKNKKKIKAGLQSDLGNNSDNQDSYQLNLSTGGYDKLDLFSSNVTYKQDIYAGYFMLSGEQKKLGYQFGIRSEYTDRSIYTETLNISTAINRLDWFPSAHFSYNLDKKNQLKANFSRRIKRPKSWNLEPFISWEDPYTVRRGNANLLPEYIQSYELGYIRNLKKGTFSAEAYFRNTINNIERIQEVYDTNAILKRPVNSGTSQVLGGEFSYRKKIKKWWSFDIGVNSFLYKIKGDLAGENINNESYSYNIRLNNSFNILDSWKFQVVSKYLSPQATIQGTKGTYFVLDLALKKDLWDNKIAATFQFTNALNSIKKESTVETSILYTHRLASPKWPIFSLSLSFRINNFNKKDKIKTIRGDEF